MNKLEESISKTIITDSNLKKKKSTTLLIKTTSWEELELFIQLDYLNDIHMFGIFKNN